MSQQRTTPDLAEDLNPAPFLKWAGGKARLLKQFETYFPTETFETYYEPFVGGGAVFFHLRQRGIAERYVLSDINEELINIYRVVRDDVEGLMDKLAEHDEQHSERYYYRTRKLDRRRRWQKQATDVERAARMIYLNKTCFNGLWRVNSKGQFNVPMGDYANPRILDEERLRAASAALQGVCLRSVSFENAVREADAGDFVYFDPPYVPLNDTSNFTSYTRQGFGMAAQERLAAVCGELDERGVRFMLSNSDTEDVHQLYEGFRVEKVTARRAINSKGNGRGKIFEVVVLNGDRSSS